MTSQNQERWYKLFAVTAGCAIFILAYANQLNFPFPWNDEARFYLPALWWVEHGCSLSPLNLNAPLGIYWVPDGLTLFLGLAMMVFGHSIEVAKLICETTVALGVFMFAMGFRKLSGSWKIGGFATLLLITPPVIFAANMVRMEAPIFLLIAVVLLLHLNGYVLAAGALLFSGLLFHPAVGIAAAAYAVINVAVYFNDKSKPLFTVLEYAVVFLVVIAFILEGMHIFDHLDVFIDQMSYQVERKLAAPLHKKILKPQGAILFICLVVTVILLYKRRLWKGWAEAKNILPIAAIGLGLMIYGVLGFEMPYNVYSLSLGPAIIFCLAGKVFYRDDIKVTDSQACPENE